MQPPTLRVLYGAGVMLALCVSALGCGARNEQPRVELPRLDPEAAAQDAVRTYDANKDGRLDSKELEKCPALVHAFKSYDADGDGKLSREEITQRLTRTKEGVTAFMGITCGVTLGDTPLSGAKVTFVPEAFLGAAFKPASGISDEFGNVNLEVEGVDLPGLYCGLYRVTVSKLNAQGKETIPARYNAQTTLGFEVAPDMRDGNILLRVTQR